MTNLKNFRHDVPEMSRSQKWEERPENTMRHKTEGGAEDPGNVQERIIRVMQPERVTSAQRMFSIVVTSKQKGKVQTEVMYDHFKAVFRN